MHTPGPWIADDVFVGAKNAEHYHVTCRGDHAEADAALIAAAPDLMAALQDLADAVERFTASPQDWPELAAARAAIIKAMGGQP